jgi:hypothetical protein
MKPMRTYRELFAVREFRALFAAQCLNVAASSISSLALGTITFSATRSPILTGLAIFGGQLVRLVASWFLLSASDLLRPRQALVAVAASTCGADLLQSLPGLAWGIRFVILALPFVVMAATGGSMLGLVSDILPAESFVFGRSTLNVAVGVMQIAGYGFAGLLLLHVGTTALFLSAAAAAATALVLLRLRIGDHAPRAAGGGMIRRTREINRQLLASTLLRPVFLALWLPNGLIVGCEALFVPFAGRQAGYLYASTAAGMLMGDIVVGRFVSARLQDALIDPLRMLLAIPYLAFVFHPSLPLAVALGFIASAGYAASLPLQERLVTHTDPAARGQVLGLNTTGVMAMQGIGATLAGCLAQALGSTRSAASVAIFIMAATSLAVSVALVPGLRRSRATILRTAAVRWPRSKRAGRAAV